MVLITGGAGYIGSHTASCLLDAGHDILILDNLSNSFRSTVDRLQGFAKTSTLRFVEADLLDRELLDRLFLNYPIKAVIHFAGRKSVPESIQNPMLYYQQNVEATLNLLRVMGEHGCHRMVFSSSAAVYGDAQAVPVTEVCPAVPKSPYGHSKLMVEQVLRSIASAEPQWCLTILRYFNPVGAHPGGQLGESPRYPLSNLFPQLAQTIAGEAGPFQVFGQQYASEDGTGVRDFIHVQDLAEGHLCALHRQQPGCQTYNLGTGKGYTVLEVIAAFEQVTGQPVPFEMAPARAGDIGCLYASVELSRHALDWQAHRGLKQMVEDYWRWWCSSTAGGTPLRGCSWPAVTASNR